MSATPEHPKSPDTCGAHSVHRLVEPKIVIHEPIVTLKYDKCGGVDVMLDDWVYVHINYDYRYTDNASRTGLANQIVDLLRPNESAQRCAAKSLGL